MLSRVLAFFTFVILPVQESPPAPADKPLLTLQNEQTIEQFIEMFEAHGWGEVHVGDVEEKRFKVDLKEVGFCRALDELCRRHGYATYFRPEYNSQHTPKIAVRGEPWVEYPTSYHGHYKVIVSHLLHTKRRTADGDQEWMNIRLVLFGPPWARINHSGVSRPTWTMQSVQGADGRDLLAGSKSDDWQSIVHVTGEYDDEEGNLLGHSLSVKSPGAERALKLIRGSANVEIAEIGVARLPFRAGESVEIEGAGIKIAAIEAKDDRWEVQCVAERKGSGARWWVRDILDGHFRFEGSSSWESHFINDGPGGKAVAFEVKVRAEKEPGWIEFRYLQKKRRVDIPFTMENVRFDK